MKIQYTNSTDFYDGIAQMVQRGLQFEADYSNYSITLTGGY